MAKWVFIGVVALCIFLLPLVMPNWLYFGLKNGFKPKRIVDTLAAPTHIVAVKETGLITDEGKLLTLPNVSAIPKVPRVWKDILDYGVELNTNGSTYALIHVHHWCGNDPVKYHLARVDLSSLCMAINDRPNVNITEFGIDPTLFAWAKLPHEEAKEIFGAKTNAEPQFEARPQ